MTASPRILELQKLADSLHMPLLPELAFHESCAAARGKASENSKQVSWLHLSTLHKGSVSWATDVNKATLAMPCTKDMPMLPLNVRIVTASNTKVAVRFQR